MKVTIDVDDGLAQRAKQLAEAEGIPMEDLLSRVLSTALDRRRPRPVGGDDAGSPRPEANTTWDELLDALVED